MSRYTLKDGITSAVKHGSTFKVPTLAEIDAIKLGDYIKIGVEFNPNPENDNFAGERFWLIVTEIQDKHTYVGEINNDLVFSTDHGLVCGNTLTVERRHILDIYRNE